MNSKTFASCATAFSSALLFSVTANAWAQQPARTVLPVPPPPFQGTVTKGAPNILLILMDDAGYGQTSAFGGLVPTPTLEGLAAGGLRYTRFGVNALCSPTRASLMTGRNNHAVGMGTITDWANGFPGYTGSIPKSAATQQRASASGTWCRMPKRRSPAHSITGPRTRVSITTTASLARPPTSGSRS